MKFTETLVFLFLLYISQIFISGFLVVSRKQDNQIFEAMVRCESVNFISKSFCNACNGSGFENLIEWQKVCKALFELDYIGFGDVREFCDISEDSKEKVLYGRWEGKWGSGEVYYKL